VVSKEVSRNVPTRGCVERARGVNSFPFSEKVSRAMKEFGVKVIRGGHGLSIDYLLRVTGCTHVSRWVDGEPLFQVTVDQSPDFVEGPFFSIRNPFTRSVFGDLCTIPLPHRSIPPILKRVVRKVFSTSLASLLTEYDAFVGHGLVFGVKLLAEIHGLSIGVSRSLY
jgi:hypothetical protein